MAIINFEQMKATEPDRNFDNATIDENYNIGMQNGAGLYGAGKFFGLVQKAVNWLSTITGNKNFTGVVSMNDKKVATEEKAGELIATALTDYPTNSQTDTKINNALANYTELKIDRFNGYPTNGYIRIDNALFTPSTRFIVQDNYTSTEGHTYWKYIVAPSNGYVIIYVRRTTDDQRPNDTEKIDITYLYTL